MSELDLLLNELVDPSGLDWKDETYSVARAKELTGPDRATYVAKLTEKADVGDTRAILTLGHLPVLEAVPMLLDASKNQYPWAPTARRALVLLGSGHDVIDAIVADATGAQASMTRIAAMLDLKTLGGSKAMKAFDSGLDDPDSTVRVLAWEGIISSYDLESGMRDAEGKLSNQTALDLARSFLAVDIRALNRIGAEDIRTILSKLASGASPESLGITYTPNPAPEVIARVSAATFDDDLAYPTADLRAVSGVARKRAEALIASRALKDDPRVGQALVELGAVWTVPVLEEIAQSDSIAPETRAQLNKAIRDLKTA